MTVCLCSKRAGGHLHGRGPTICALGARFLKAQFLREAEPPRLSLEKPSSKLTTETGARFLQAGMEEYRRLQALADPGGGQPGQSQPMAGPKAILAASFQN